jgi:hypothetical protein
MKIGAYCKGCALELDATGADWAPLRCGQCSRVYELAPNETLRAGGAVDRCCVCGYEHLHIRKDFPRRLGLAIVLVAAVLCFTKITPPGWFFLPLVVASVVDLLLYQVIPWKVVCYVCETEYRRTKPLPGLQPFDLAVATECKRLKWPA